MFVRCLVVIALFPAAHGFGQTVSFDGTAFPDSVGWERLDRPFLADRWLDNGWFVQYAEIVDEGPPMFGEDDFYRWELGDQAGLPTWYLEWRMVTDGPEAFWDVAPASIVAGGTSGVLYHFTIAEDQVRLIRDTQLPIVYADIDPGVPHLYRLELRGSESYRFSIDGVEIDAGVPEGPYPTSDSRITFGARASIEASTTRWDYVEFGPLDPAIPTVSEWGIAIMTLLVLTTATVIFGRHRRTSICPTVT